MWIGPNRPLSSSTDWWWFQCTGEWLAMQCLYLYFIKVQVWRLHITNWYRLILQVVVYVTRAPLPV